MGVIMDIKYNKQDKYYLAQKKVEALKGFYGNLIAFVVVNIGLIFINLYTSPDHLWFYWPLLWWGLGVLFHGLQVFDLLPTLGKEWQERKIKEIMDKEKEEQKKWQ